MVANFRTRSEDRLKTTLFQKSGSSIRWPHDYETDVRFLPAFKVQPTTLHILQLDRGGFSTMWNSTVLGLNVMHLLLSLDIRTTRWRLWRLTRNPRLEGDILYIRAQYSLILISRLRAQGKSCTIMNKSTAWLPRHGQKVEQTAHIHHCEALRAFVLVNDGCIF